MTEPVQSPSRTDAARRKSRLEPILSLAGPWAALSRIWQIRLTRSAGPATIDAVTRRRFTALVRHARKHSPLYRDLYRGLPAAVADPHALPVVSKRQLMDAFDDWVTDRAVNLRGVEGFLSDRAHIGDRYLGRYIVWKSSGTTGDPGIYIQDDDALAAFDALMAVQFDPFRDPLQYWNLMLSGCRLGLIAATGDHFASIASWQRLRRSSPWLAARSFSIMEPLGKLVAALNDYQPTFLASYPTMLALLAEEQAAGRLTLRPARLWAGGECLAPETAAAIERAFDCPLTNEYGASECMSIAFGCPEGWLHVNADWVRLEPVDAAYQPVPPGTASHTVLLTNLANRVQPIIRYDLGDSVIAKEGPCACGNPLPAIQVEGRRDDIVSLRAASGDPVRLLPLALTTVVEEATSVHRFQIAQTAPDRLTLRFGIPDGPAKREAWAAAAHALRDYLDGQSLAGIALELDAGAPRADSKSGKLREVVVEMATAREAS